MRDEIIKRNTIITTVTMLIFFVVSLIITSYTSRKSIEQQLINVSNVVNNQILATNSEEELNEVVKSFTKDQEWLQIVIASNIGVILTDSSDDSINVTTLKKLTDEEIKLATSSINTDRVYIEDDKIYYITLINEDIIVRTAIMYEKNTELILMSLFYLALLLIVVILLSVYYNKKVSNNVITTFNDICFNLKSINDGKYIEIDTTHKYSEVQDVLSEINEINNNIYVSMLKIKNEHDKLDFVINNMQQGIIIINKYGNILLINDYATNSLNIENNNVDNIHYNKVIKNEVLLERLDKALENKSNYYFDISDENKSKIYSCNISYLRNVWNDLNKDERLYVVVIMDVTSDRENDKIKADFISNASHELKTPITSIRGFSELLLVDSSNYDEKTKKYLNIIYNESIKMKDTIDELLYLSNLEYHRNETEQLEQIYFSDVIDDIIDEYDSLARLSKITINKDIDDSYIYEQTKLLTHLIKNLVENAIKYNKPNGEVNISVKKEKHKIVLKVEDTGIGIEEKHLDKIFKRFYRVDTSHNSTTGGTGLGLNIAQKICSLLNAKISVSSTLDIGTTFTVEFNKE